MDRMTAVDAAVEQRPVFDVFEGFALASVLASLDEAGLLAELEARPVSAAPQGVADPDRLMPAALRYLAQRELVEQRDGAFALTERGRAIVKDKGYLVWLQGGYGHVLGGL